MVDRLKKDPQAALQKLALEENFLGREVLFRQARKQLLEKTRGHYPAPLAALEAIQAGRREGHGGRPRDRGPPLRRAGRFTRGAKQLMGIFFATTALKKDNGTSDPSVKGRQVEQVGILGGGLMGSGIAYVTVNAGIPVRIREKDDAAVARALAAVAGDLRRPGEEALDGPPGEALPHAAPHRRDRLGGHGAGGRARRGGLRGSQAQAGDAPHLRDPEPEGHLRHQHLVASPSGRSPRRPRHPETVLGMHYFSPVNKMPLLEVIVTPRTADEVTATAVALGQEAGEDRHRGRRRAGLLHQPRPGART